MLKIGVLALQGDFAEHISMVTGLGVQAVQVRYQEQIEELDGLIIPGGESTAIARLTDDGREPIFQAILRRASFKPRDGRRPMPVYGTCMGSIFLAKRIEGSSQGRLALMDITVNRNAFGPQKNSFAEELPIKGLGMQAYKAVFIRAPMITAAEPHVEVLAEVEAFGRSGICMARQEHLLVSTFHPELTTDSRVHRYFLNMVEAGCRELACV
jgi:5'-phosphate synthase pdxT subunit